MATRGILANARYGNWSLYDSDGNQAVPFDTFFSLDINNEGKVTTYPTEPNSFAAYNKVFNPIVADVVVGVTGDSIDRTEVLEALDDLLSGTDLVSIVTPEKTFTDYALESYSYSRTAEDGYDRLKVQLRLVEVKQVSSEYSNETIASAQNASDSSTKSAGKTTTSTTTTSEKTVAETKSSEKTSSSQSILSAITS